MFEEDEEEQQETINRSEQRIKKVLSERDNLAQQKEELAKAKEEAEKAAQDAQKEVEFYKEFSKVASNPQFAGVAEYQDEVLEKVRGGYTPEDAALSILNREGKYTPQAAPQVTESPAGGSATTNMTVEGEKTLGEMSRDEKREALMKAEAENGSISQIMRANQS